jgi:L-ascorbate metabolism protein UlaG (beta-lactamase superfamily)
MHLLLLLPLLLSSPNVGDVEIVPITHGSLILKWQGKAIHVDPWSKGNYEGQPQADVVLVTDIHGDHMDADQIAKVSKSGTVVIAPAAVQKTVQQAQVLNNGEETTVMGVTIQAVPMYNLKRGPEAGKLYHTKGRGNGYVLTFGDQRIYISGDTECIPEMKELKDIDMAFVCMNLPYTMTPEEAAGCVNAFKPKAVSPYHYRDSDLNAFKEAVTAPEVEVQLLDWY